MKPLYGVSEAGNHWFATYHTYQRQTWNEKVNIQPLPSLQFWSIWHCGNANQ